MKKRIKLILISAASALFVITFIIVFHFVPFDSRTGHLFGVDCSKTQPSYAYRWDNSKEFDAWDNQLSHLDENNYFPKSHCAQTTHVRLYLF